MDLQNIHICITYINHSFMEWIYSWTHIKVVCVYQGGSMREKKGLDFAFFIITKKLLFSNPMGERAFLGKAMKEKQPFRMERESL